MTADRYRRDAAVRVWDVATGKVERSFPAAWKPEARVWRSRLSPDGKVLAVTYQGEMRGLRVESEVKLWDIATGKERDDPRPYWFDLEVMAFGPDGKTVAAPTPDGKVIQFRDAATGQVRGEFRGPRDRVTALAFGPDGRLFTGSLDGTVLAWDLAGRRAVRPPAGSERHGNTFTTEDTENTEEDIQKNNYEIMIYMLIFVLCTFLCVSLCPLW